MHTHNTPEGPDFTGANLDGATFHGMDLSNARGLTQDQISRANFDENCKLPEGLHVSRIPQEKTILVRHPHTGESLLVPISMASMFKEPDPWYERAMRDGSISSSTYYLSVAQDAWLERRKQEPPQKSIQDLRMEQDHNANMAFAFFAIGIVFIFILPPLLSLFM